MAPTPLRPPAPPVAPRPSNQPPTNHARVAALSNAPPPPRPSSIASSHSNPDESDDDDDDDDSPPLNATKPTPASNTPQPRPALRSPPAPTAQAQSATTRRVVRDRFPALNLISALLRGISANDPRRGAQVFAQVLESSHTIYDAVAVGVEELKSSKTRDAPARRTLFDGWTTAACILEE